ncbi:MAG: tetratricopeptide repeat protein [Acetobacteraceae bacterium]|nr:tetratricopeptide repeat protein [Acetobacteraceae bacterium]
MAEEFAGPADRPLDVTSRLQAALDHLQDGRPSDAEGLLRITLAEVPRHPDVLNLLGVSLQMQARPEDAIPYLAQAVSLQPESGMYRANFGAALALAGRGRDAAAELERSLELRPDNPIAKRNLGVVLAGMLRGPNAIPELERATGLAPDAPEPHLALAHAYLEAKRGHEAAEAASRALAQTRISPKQAEQAAFLRDAARGGSPDRAPAAYVRELFDVYAQHFDAELVGKLAYRTPELLGRMLERLALPAGGAALDLGCGTGLSGLVLKPFAGRLHGADISAKMLELAGRRGIYDELFECDFLDWLPRLKPCQYGIVLAADVLNYIGELSPVLLAVAPVLEPGGVFAFSLEKPEPGAPVQLTSALRFQHDADAVIEAARALGLELAARGEAEMRMEAGKPVIGTLLALRRH